MCVTVSRMDPETQRKLDRVLLLTEENNTILREVRRSQKTTQMMKAIYWVIIIMVTVGSLYFVQPYLGTLSSLYGGLKGSQTGDTTSQSSASNIQIPDVKQLQGLIDQLKK